MSLNFAATPFSYIAQQVVARVASAVGIGTEFVRPVAADDYKVTEAENLFVYLRFYQPSPVDARTGASFADQGAGRHLRVVGRRLRSYIYTRSGVDVYGGDEIALMGHNPSGTVESPSVPGQWLAEELVLNALDDYMVASGERPLTLGPIHWVDPGGGPAERKPENEEGLVRSHLDFQIVYVETLQNTEPAPDTGALPVLTQN